MPRSILIVGAGPVGLHLALLLNKNNFNLLCVDPRLGEYTRPGDIDGSAFEIVQNSFPTFPVELAIKDRHLKKLERNLLALAEENHVPRMKLRFQECRKDGSIVLANPSNPEKISVLTGFEYIIDCTGSKRNVFKSVLGEALTTTFIGTNPLPSHFVAEILIGPNDQPLTDTEKCLQITKLQDFGWPVLCLPYLKVKKLSNKPYPGFTENTLRKVLVYGECPPSLQEKDLEKWLPLVLPLQNYPSEFKRVKAFSSIGLKKPNFTLFKMTPDKIDSVFFETNSGVKIIAAGDCLISPDYRLGIGVKEGLNRNHILMDCIYCDWDGNIIFDATRFTKEVRASFPVQEERTEKLYLERKKAIERESARLEANTRAALTTETDPVLREQLQTLLSRVETINMAEIIKHRNIGDNALTKFYQNQENAYLKAQPIDFLKKARTEYKLARDFCEPNLKNEKVAFNYLLLLSDLAEVQLLLDVPYAARKTLATIEKVFEKKLTLKNRIPENDMARIQDRIARADKAIEAILEAENNLIVQRQGFVA